MRTLHKILLASAAAAVAVAAAPRAARAQIDVDPPPPNVLLLVDTSGSMEYLIQANALGKNQLPKEKAGAACTGVGAPSELNRWATLVSVLTGTINNFSCKEVARDTSAFIDEYTVSGTSPYDAKYYLPWNRLLSNGCTLGPGTLPVNWWEWPSNALKWHDISHPLTTCVQPWSQQNDGILDTFRDRVRFGMMTFDPFPDAGTGISGNAPNMTTGNAGIWSYFAGWNGGLGSPAKGRPAGCATDLTYEVGARNPAAPPWEGRLLGFPPPDGKLTDQQLVNDHIQESLIAMRPFGATPIAGMFADAKEYLLNDTSKFPPASSTPFGLKGDGFYDGGCRKTFIILLSDGEPNEDMRPECEGTNTCPYTKPDEIALQLASLPGTNKQIKTFVIGFGVSDAAELAKLGLSSCSQLDYNQHCTSPAKGLKACCELTKIAKSGGTNNAFFADSLTALKGQLSTVLSGIASGATARTVPIFSSGASALGGLGTGNAPADAYRFVGKFTADPTGKLWSGDLKRQRLVCTTANGTTKAVPQAPDPLKGDDFALNVNSNDPTNKRQFFTMIGPKVSGAIHSSRSIRPGVTANNDGMGVYGSGASATALNDGPTFASQIANSPEAFGLTGGVVPQTCSATLKAGSTTTCVEKLVRWEVGEVNNDLLPTTRDADACAQSGACSELGSIYHSTPAVIGPPRDFINDSSYTDFALLQEKRPLVLYTASTDGQLRAFKVKGVDQNDPNKVDGNDSNNELWSFLPPAVLPNLLSSYDQQVLLLDGSPVVADVVLDRRRGQAAKWSTVLVAGGGPAGGFYYALDVTDPTKPKFLWQLSSDDGGAPLFGSSTATPAITTIVLPDTSSGTADVKEVAVAILPGGASTMNAGPCARSTNSLMKPGKYSPRAQVRCWAPGPGRSVTIVRLDNGEVIMNFRASAAEGPPGLNATKMKIVPEISSPITGVPVPYPGTTGQLADRVYVGDADGNLWRINIPGDDLSKWSMDLAWDAYPTETVGPSGATIGEPVQTPPIISTNALGDVVIMYSAADQQLLSPNAAMDARIWSLVERKDPVSGKYQLEHNWYEQFLGGERVTGPMAIFNSVAYFSSYAPAGPGALCSFGSSKIWALDYLSGAGRFPIPAQPGTFKKFAEAENTIVFGVSVTQTPSCVEDTGTPYSPMPQDKGRTQLAFQIPEGSPGVTDPGIPPPDDAGIQTIDLQSPPQGTRLESWAGIID